MRWAVWLCWCMGLRIEAFVANVLLESRYVSVLHLNLSSNGNILDIRCHNSEGACLLGAAHMSYHCEQLEIIYTIVQVPK